MRRTKIVCTIGPGCKDESVLEEMLKNGLNVARFNFSHGTHEYHKQLMDTFRAVRDRMGVPAALMLDTKGPEIRLRNFRDGKVFLETGAEFTLTTEDVEGDETRASITFVRLPEQVHEGVRLLMDDGRIAMTVLGTTKTEIRCRVDVGGYLSNHKSVNVPNFHIDMPYISPADEADLLFGIKENVDFVAASFVRSEQDVIALRRFLDYHGGHRIKIISKIENIEGVNNFDKILEHSDGIMVARGDMGVEVAFERLPGLQKRFIRKCYQSGKMVITATQMLESMIHASTPTRAEITDVANAVFDGTSAVMLSGETATGDHPPLVVKVMAQIAEQAENDAMEMNAYQGMIYDPDTANLTNAICDAAATTARDVHANVIIAITISGHAARLVSKFRPSQPIVAATPEIKTFHQLSLSWGVTPVLSLPQRTTEELFIHAIDCAKQIDIVKKGDKAVITAGVPLDISGMTNLLKVQIVE